MNIPRRDPATRDREWLKPTIRARLTALYGSLFLIAGILLIGLMHWLTWRAINVDLTREEVSRYLPGYLPNLPLSQQYDLLVQAALRAQNEQQSLLVDHLLRKSLLTLVIFAVVAFACGYLVAGRVLRPLHAITASARRVGRGDLNERIALEGPDDELKELADTFDEMLERLSQAMAGQRRFVANASHELRTPLAVNRTLLEVALTDPEAGQELRQLARTLLSNNERHELMIEGLLALAKSEGELAERRPTALPEVVERALTQVTEEAAGAGVTVRSRLDPAVGLGDGVLLERLALNLFQNAVRHNCADGWLEVSTRTEQNRVLLTVTNTGPQIADYEVDGLFEPFRRLRRTGRGVGLGLSIVRSIVRAHDGQVSARSRPEGGLTVTVTLPAA